jgi:hypothetical protein
MTNAPSYYLRSDTRTNCQSVGSRRYKIRIEINGIKRSPRALGFSTGVEKALSESNFALAFTLGLTSGASDLKSMRPWFK